MNRKHNQLPTAFISYSWDSEDHCSWVRDLAKRLRGDGVDVTIDQWAAVPGDQLPEFMERAICDNDHVLVICTSKYKSRSDNRTGGVGYEGDIITAEVLVRRNHRKFIPILRGQSWDSSTPSWVLGKFYVDLSVDPYSEEQYARLLATLHRLPLSVPPVGDRPETIQLPDGPEEHILQFAAITAARGENGGETSAIQPNRFSFNLACAAYLRFGTVDPVIDVSVVNRSKRSVVVSAVGVEVVSVAQTWRIGAILEPRVIPVSVAVEIVLPNIWGLLRERGIHTGGKTLADYDDISPQQIGERVSRSLPDPYFLDPDCPFRYTLALQEYSKMMPDEAIIRFWITTSEGEFCSRPVFIQTINHVLHAMGQKDHEFEQLRTKADRFYPARDFPSAEKTLREAIAMQGQVSVEVFATNPAFSTTWEWYCTNSISFTMQLSCCNDPHR